VELDLVKVEVEFLLQLEEVVWEAHQEHLQKKAVEEEVIH
jgi:hypothetical protein